MKRLFALVFFMILLFVFISCSEATAFKTDDSVDPDPTETDNTPSTITQTGELTEEKEKSTTEFVPPQTTSSTTTTTTIPITTTTAPITTAVKPTTKAPKVTTAVPPTTTTSVSFKPYGAEGYVAPNKHLTWEEAYKDNGDGTFTVTYRSGHVTKYYPHPEVEGHFTPSLQYPSDLRFDAIKGFWEGEICDQCGEFSFEVQGYVRCIRYTRDKNCPECGEWVKASTCHYCANKD